MARNPVAATLSRPHPGPMSITVRHLRVPDWPALWPMLRDMGVGDEPQQVHRLRFTALLADPRWALLGDDTPGLAGALAAAGNPVRSHADLAALVAEIGESGDVPDVVLDLRSGAYAATWTPRGALAERTLTVRVLHERTVDGTPTRSVVSHFNKATKGRLVRDLLLADARPRTADALVGALRELKYTVEEAPRATGRPRQVDLVVTEL